MDFINAFRHELVTLGFSMMPISEIRGSIIYAAANLDSSVLNIVGMYILSVIGNFLPVPFIILLFRPIINWLKKTKMLSKFAHWLEERTHKKAKGLSKVSVWAIFFFVAIPFPTTGAWTGSMIAALLNMRLKESLPAILCGIMVSGLIMVLLCMGVLSFGALDQFFLKTN